jgi:quercetin dioxygenase-like cupin family protein
MNNQDQTAQIKPSVASLLEMLQYQNNAIVSSTIIKKDTGTVTLFAFSAGQSLSEHTAPFDAMVQILEGQATIRVADQSFTVNSNEYIILPAGVPHALRAEQDLKMLLIMIKS